MTRTILTVNATQIVVSENHPEGLYSVMSGFPKAFDSFNNDGDIDATMKQAKASYFDQLSKNYANTNPSRVMTTVMLYAHDGTLLMHESVGQFPTPEPEPSHEDTEIPYIPEPEEPEEPEEPIIPSEPTEPTEPTEGETEEPEELENEGE